MRQRLRFVPARLYVAGLVVVLVAVGLFVVVRGQEKPAASPVPTLPPGVISPLEEALQGIRDDGTWSKETALAVFAASFGPLPDVPTPRPDPSYRSGSLAIRMVEAYWSELTDAQKQAIKGYIGPAAASAVPAAFHPDLAIVLDAYQGLVDAAVADVGAAFGRPLSIPYKVVLGDKENGGAWAWATAEWTGPPGSLAPDCTMTFPPSTAADPSRAPYLRWLVLHEVWHCFQYSMIDFLTYKSSPPWVTEGSASWVAEAITGGAGAPPPEVDHWKRYLLDPGKSLYKREYDAVGFYAQLAHNSIDPWKVVDLMVKAGGSDAAFEASGANTSTFIDRYGSSWFRDAMPTDDWAMQSGYGIPDPGTHAVPAPITITDGVDEPISAKPLAGAIAAVDTTAFVTHFEVSGVGRVADPAGAGLDMVVRAGTLDLCTSPAGDCRCPPGSVKTPTAPDRAPGKLHAMASGEEHSSTVMDIRGISKDDWCGAKATPQQEAGDLCTSGCAGSNGDPHMRTVDKAQYDLQAVGEYVLLRSSDGTLEIQGRQERPSSGGDASVNTAVAVKVNGHRAGFYNTDPGKPASVKVDGASVGAPSPDLGPGATLSSLVRGYELDFPDGSRLWVLAAARAISITVVPSAALKASAVGLLARVPSNAGLRVPATADGKTFPVPLTPQERFHDIYDALGPSWRVTAANSLFDYDAGKTTDSYVLPDFPPATVPETLGELPPAAVASAKTTCAGVADPDLAEQCAYDVAVTGTVEFATLYTMADDLQTDGPASLSQPIPGTSPTPTPGGGGLDSATGLSLVADHLAGVASAALGPDGTVYLEVGEAGQGIDFTRALLAVDPATGKMRQRALPTAYGTLATAAGSIWAGEFKRSDTTFCQVSRLDPVTLAAQASVTTVCSGDGQTDFAAFADTIWFADPTGADATGNGGHLRRVDPTTNKVDTTPGGSVDLPFVSSFMNVQGTGSLFTGTSDGLIYGDHQHGWYFLEAGSDAFHRLTLPADASTPFAAGSGVWSQTKRGTSQAPEGLAAFASADSTSGAQVGINGILIGADDLSLYAEQSDDDAQPDELWRYPIDRSAPAKLAVSALVPDGFGGTRRLSYRELEVALLVGDHEVVKIWKISSPTNPDQAAVVLQAAPIP